MRTILVPPTDLTDRSTRDVLQLKQMISSIVQISSMYTASFPSHYRLNPCPVFDFFVFVFSSSVQPRS